MAKISPNSVALAGEFAVLSQLSLRGYNASMTLGNTKGIDILVQNPTSRERFQVEVKTNLERRNGPSHSKLFGKFVTDWQMHAKHEKEDADIFYCFVHINQNRKDSQKYDYRFFIVPGAVVAKYVTAEHALWLKADKSHKDNLRRLFRIGLPNDREIAVETPLASQWENNWAFNMDGCS